MTRNGGAGADGALCGSLRLIDEGQIAYRNRMQRRVFSWTATTAGCLRKRSNAAEEATRQTDNGK